ncbi:hypothetical protein, partial [Mucilaginibacter sp.]|uniref:hypothetical protein n=1 Tax=Mucilaginibacter sp. TaxID=1882438 RepID=UPI002612DDE8
MPHPALSKGEDSKLNFQVLSFGEDLGEANKKAFLFAEEGFIWFCLCFYTIRLSSSEIYPGGNNSNNCGVVNCHIYYVGKVS